MKNCLSTLFLILISTASGLGSVVSRWYTYYSSASTWHEAQAFCRRFSTDLATFYKQSEVDSVNLKHYLAWIGLHQNSQESDWIWSDGQSYDGNNWADNEPGSSESCGAVTYNRNKFYGSNCETYHFFYCYKTTHHHNHISFVSQSKKWSEAQQYCKNKYTNLRYFRYLNSDNFAEEQDFPVWIGLHRVGTVWKWSLGLSNYTKWDSHEPRHNRNCVSISSVNKKMATQICSSRFPFACFRDNLLLVKENKTWEQALEHCRGLEQLGEFGFRYELVSVQPGDDQHYISIKAKEATTEKVWIGLRFLAGYWFWVNGENMQYTDLPTCPMEGQRCGALTKNESKSVEPRDCMEKRNFICYRKW